MNEMINSFFMLGLICVFSPGRRVEGRRGGGGVGLSRDGLASHPGGVVMLLGASCWAPCDGLASHSGEVVMLLGASCMLGSL